MAKVKLGDWGTYNFYSGTSTPLNQDYQVRYYLSYEQNTTANTTTVYVQPYIYCYNKAPITFPKTSIKITTNINGTAKSQTISTSNTMQDGYFSYWGTTHSFTITHADDGTASCTLKGSATDDNSTTRTCSHTWTLPTINRASSISNNTSATSKINFGSPVTFTISRPSTSITHTLTYVSGGVTYNIPSDGSAVGESVSYTFPTTLIKNHTGTSEVTYTVTCKSSNGTTSTTQVYLKIPDTYAPKINSITLSEAGNVPSDWGIWLKSKSKVKVVIDAVGQEDATISTYYSTLDGVPYNANTFTTGELKTSGTLTLATSVTDSRGKVTSTTKNLTVVDYFKPTIVSLEVARCNASGTLDNDGTYGKVICKYKIASCNSKNTKSFNVKYGNITIPFDVTDYEGTITATSSKLFSGLATTSNHTFTASLGDSLETTTQDYIMPPSFVLMSKRAGGKGISFGQVATEDGFNVYMDAKFSKILNALDGLTTSKLKLGRVEYSPKTMSQLIANATTSSTSFNTGYSHLFWVNWADYSIYPGYAGMSGFYFQGTQSNSGYIFAIPYQANYFLINCNIDGTRWSGWQQYGTSAGVYDGLDATSTTHALSANQGRILNNKINAIPQKTLQWVTVTTTKTWSLNTLLTYNNVLEGAIAIWIGGKVYTTNTGLSSMMIPMSLITTTETNFLINDELYWVRTGMYREGNNLKVVDRGRAKDGWVSNIYVLKYA